MYKRFFLKRRDEQTSKAKCSGELVAYFKAFSVRV